MSGFTQVFGGTTIYPSDVSYRAIALTANVTLTWPLETASGSDVLASIIDITPTGAYAITMPDATLTSVGQTVLFNNLGPSTVTIKDSAGATLLSLAAGEVWQIYLIDNATSAGLWRSFKYGATTAQAQASLLAGYGLVAIGSTLAQSSSVVSLAVNYTLGDADRAKTFVWSGGLGTFTLPVAIAVGNNWFVNVRNGGTGDLVVDPSGSEIINGGLTITLSPGDSAVIVTDGISWYTIGLGQQAVFAFDYTTISLTGLSGTYTLSGSELNRISYKFTGTLTGNILIIVPSTVQQYWIDNSTSGSAYTMSVSTLGGTPVTIAQNLRAIYYCNGSNVIKADTTSGVATPISILDGGTGATSAPAALINLGGTSVGTAVFTATSPVTGRLALLAAASGANSDITSLSGLTTPLSPAQGGTGITSLGTGVATALGVNVGTAGSFTVNGGVGSFTSLAYTTTLTGGTGIVNLGSGQFYKDASGNVGIGTTGNTLYKLQATGLISSFTAAQAGYHLYNGGATAEWFMGQRSAVNHSLSFSKVVASVYTDYMVISTGGLVGIGTTAPATQLDVRNGDITVSRTAAATAGDAALNFGNGGANYIFAGNTSNIMAFAVNSSERMRINASGNVGIGTSSPIARLDVAGANSRIRTDLSTTTTVVTTSDVGGGTYQNYAMDALSYDFRTLGTSKIVVDSVGNVGIGLSSPSLYGKLAVVGTGTVISAVGGDGTSETQVNFYANTAARISNQANTPLIFGTNTLERMRIDASGNVGIGTSSPAYNLHVRNSGGNSYIASQYGTGTIGYMLAAANEVQFRAFNGTSDVMTFLTGASERVRIDATGNVGIGTSAPKSRLQSSAGTSLNAPVLGSATNAPFYYSNNDAAYGVLFGNSAADGHGWIQAQRTDGTALAYNLTLNEAGGSVGVGTTTPEYKLHVANGYTGIGALNTTTLAPSSAVGVAAFSWNRSSGNGEINIANTFNGATSSFEFLQKTGASTANVLYQMASSSHIFYTANTEKMRIDSSGNVGIGTSSTTNKLQIDGGAVQNTGLGSIGQYELVYGSASTWYNSGWRNDGSNAYFLVSNVQTTQAAAKSATFNSLRPLIINLASGTVNIDQTGAGGTTFGGVALAVGAGGLGYGTGSGGAVTQLTSRTTGVTLNKTNGAITMFSAAGNASPQTFVVTNSTVAATDVVVVSVRSSTNVYFVACTSTSNGAFAICFYSLSGTATDAPVINYAVIKAVTA